MTPSISVALCTFQGERYIAEQLQSILQQTLLPDEIVVGDDGSTDRTIDIVRDIAKISTVPLTVLEHSGLGVAQNFATTIAATKGDVLALCDQDDVWKPDKLARLVPELASVDLVHTDARLVDGDGHPLGMTLLGAIEASEWERSMLERGDALPVLLRRNLVTGATVLVNGATARAALPVPAGWIHDEWLAVLCALGRGVQLVPEPLIDYRQHGKNAIGVAKLSLKHKFARLIATDSGEHERKALRATSLATEAQQRELGTPGQRAMLIDKARHERSRAALPTNRIARIPGVARIVVTGAYSKYSRGMLDIARDLLEAH